MPLSVKQGQVIHAILNGPARSIVLDGAIRSDKTLSTLLAWATWIDQKAPAGPLVMIGRTRDTIQRNLIEPLAELDHGIVTHVTTRSTTATVMGRKVYLIGANDAQAESKIRGLTLAGAYVDEATLLPEAFFVQLTGRLSVPGATLIATTNPDSPAHWLKTRYLDKAGSLGWAYYQFTMNDNPALTPEYVEAKRREFTGLWRRRFIQGEWVSAEGAVYSMWDPTQHVVPHDSLPPTRAVLGVGVDYGTTNASAAIMLVLGTDGVLYAVDEWREDSTETTRYTDGQLSNSLRTWLTCPHLPPTDTEGLLMTPRYICLDPAAASFRAQLAADGVRTERAVNNIAPGIALVATGLSEGWLRISDRCTALIREIPGYSWDPRATAVGVDRPIKTADHSCDALRYAVATLESLWRPHIRRR